jgi:anoctamin-10
MQLRRADTTLGDDTELANITYNDKYVVVYDFSKTGSYTIIHSHWWHQADCLGTETAVRELTALLADLHGTGLNTEVRRGYDQSILVFVQAPRELLGNSVYKSRYASLGPILRPY